MNILVSHVYSNDNKGDAALLSVLLSDIKRGFPGASTTVLTLDVIAPGETFDGVPMANSFMHFARERFQNPILKGIYAAYVGAYVLLWASVRRYLRIALPISKDLRATIALYENADIVIPVGGGYIRAQGGIAATITLFFILQPFWFSRILGRQKTIGYTQSVGPFGNRFQEWMAKHAVRKMDGIIVREEISRKLLEKWGITQNVFTSVDSGFGFVSASKKDIRSELGIPAGQMVVGMTVRSWLKQSEQDRYEKAVAALADHVVEKYKAMVVFIPQVTVEHHGDDDRVASRRVFALMKRGESARVIEERYDHHTIKAMYSSLDYLVGTRFHSVIFALTSYVPSIAIGYEHKTRGIMRDLGLEEWVVSIEKTEAGELISLLDKLVKERDNYMTRLKQILPAYIAQSDRSMEIVRRSV